jgi:hypothetical protein
VVLEEVVVGGDAEAAVLRPAQGAMGRGAHQGLILS